SVVVIEKHDAIGAGISSRNSEVIHAGIHYPSGSLKARLCVEGRRALYQFLDSHGVAHDRCGKLIVATDPDEIAAVDALARQAEMNGVEECVWLSGAEARALEPGLRAEAAILSHTSGVFDSHGYMFALQGEIEAHGGAIALNTEFVGAAPAPAGWLVRAGDATFSARRLVVAAGLSAQACARVIEGFPGAQIPELHFGKGVYFALAGRAPFKRLIYPPPIPGALGTHYRRDLGGVARFGPDLAYVDVEDYSVDPGRAESFYAAVRRFWSALPDGALTPDYAGIRPKLHGPGEEQGDFIVSDPTAHGLAGLVCLFGIESPGLTSSLALGEEVRARLLV
ncbi:MAG: NAD(P)/FAD-dependent oxidoreductase, partial [Hyphomonadaceae bacterium]